jgi:hypothetical protein
MYAIAVALGMYTHLTMMFTVAGHLAVYVITLFTQRNNISLQRWSGLFSGFCLAGLLTLVLYALVLPQLFGGTLGQGAEKSAAVTVWRNPLWTISESLRGLDVHPAMSVLGLIGLCIFGAGLWSFVRRRPIVIGLFCIPVIFCVAITLSLGHPLWPRLFFFSSGFIALVLVRGVMQSARLITRLFDLAPSKTLPIGLASCVGLLLVSAASMTRAYAPKQDYLSALDYVQERYQPGDTVVTVGVMTMVPYKNLYKTNWQAVDTADELKSIQAFSQKIWLLYTMPAYLQQAHTDLTIIQNDFRVVKEFHGTLGGGTIFVCNSAQPALTDH